MLLLEKQHDISCVEDIEEFFVHSFDRFTGKKIVLIDGVLYYTLFGFRKDTESFMVYKRQDKVKQNLYGFRVSDFSEDEPLAGDLPFFNLGTYDSLSSLIKSVSKHYEDQWLPLVQTVGR